ncbi:MAG: hypothetical protein R3B72_50160 [Polyangiaceae bacterium]
MTGAVLHPGLRAAVREREGDEGAAEAVHVDGVAVGASIEELAALDAGSAKVRA